MASTRHPFSHSAQCPVVQKQVVTSGTRVSLGSESQIVSKSCSNVARCLEKYGSLESLPACLLHTLRE